MDRIGEDPDNNQGRVSGDTVQSAASDGVEIALTRAIWTEGGQFGDPAVIGALRINLHPVLSAFPSCQLCFEITQQGGRGESPLTGEAGDLMSGRSHLRQSFIRDDLQVEGGQWTGRGVDGTKLPYHR